MENQIQDPKHNNSHKEFMGSVLEPGVGIEPT